MNKIDLKSTSFNISLDKGKKVFFASDFHLGVPNAQKSREREHRILKWLETIKSETQVLFLVGDIFDFWFEYKKVIPKGFVRLQGKLAEWTDEGIPIYFFTGNHDLWMFDYFTEELGVPVFHQPQQFIINNKKLLIGHGDGLGPGDSLYKLLKAVFTNKLAQWCFAQIHPNIGIYLANLWSRKSRMQNDKKGEDEFLGEKEWLWQFCKEKEIEEHHDFYIFGHRHLPLDLEVDKTSRYINLGEWVNYDTYAVFDGESLKLTRFSENTLSSSAYHFSEK